MLNSLSCLGRSRWTWLLIIFAGISMEGIALYYQYGLDYGPCVLCIHIRIWIAAMIMVAVLGLVLNNSQSGRKFGYLGLFGTGIGLLERSWQTLAVERGWVVSECDMDSGLPNWFALDKWFPQAFEPWEPCGYTPELLFRITMAEGLVAFAAVLSLFSLAFFAVQFRSSSN